MKGRKIISASVILLSFVFSICHGWTQSYTDLHLDAGRVRWTSLSFDAKRFTVKVSTDVNLTPCANKEFESLWLSHPECLPLPPARSELYRIDVNTSIDHIFSSPVELLEQVWFEPTHAAALYRIRMRRGKDDTKKAYWFTGKGVHRLRKNPGNDKEASLPSDQWSDVTRSFYAFDLTQLGFPQVSEPSVLIYIVSAFFTSKSKNSLSLCVFGKKQLHQVRLGVGEPRRVAVDYLERKGDIEVRRQGKIKVLRVKLKAQPAKLDEKDPENFSFLGLHENIAIDVNPESRIPVQVSGTIHGVGNVTLKLREMKIRK